LEGIIGFRGEDDNIGENHVPTARPDAGGAALTLLRNSRPNFTANTKEVGFQSEDGSRNGETEEKTGKSSILPRGRAPEALLHTPVPTSESN
jgi:hypothetical protein